MTNIDRVRTVKEIREEREKNVQEFDSNLRDEFAKIAFPIQLAELNKMLYGVTDSAGIIPEKRIKELTEICAKGCYILADAMMEARKKC